MKVQYYVLCLRKGWKGAKAYYSNLSEVLITAHSHSITASYLITCVGTSSAVPVLRGDCYRVDAC